MEIKQKWINENGIYFPISGDTTLYTSPGDGVFQVVEHKSMTSERIGLAKIADKFTFDFKIYDLGIEDTIEKVIKTWNSDLYVNDSRNLGVIFNGTKGTGKTIAAKILCNRLNLPVIIINEDYTALTSFIQSLHFECIVLVDEAEKTFKNNQDNLLKMIDGVYNASRKLYILTTNELNVEENLLGRPGRIRYIKEFSNLTVNAITEYINDNLLDQSKKDTVLNMVDSLEISTIDILKAIVDEVNIHGDVNYESLLNIPMAEYKFKVARFDDIDIDKLDEIKNFIRGRLRKNETIAEWLDGLSKNSDGDFHRNLDLIEAEFDCNCIKDNFNHRFSFLAEGHEVLCGTVISEPDKDGFFVFREEDYGLGTDDELCCIIKLLNPPSLYKGKLKR